MRPNEFEGLLGEVLQEMADAEPSGSLTAGVMARVEQQQIRQRWVGWGTAAMLAGGVLGMVLLNGTPEKGKALGGGGGVEERAMVDAPIKAQQRITDLTQAEGVPQSRAESSKSSDVRWRARQVRPLRAAGDAVQVMVERGLEIAPLKVSSLEVKPLARE